MPMRLKQFQCFISGCADVWNKIVLFQFYFTLCDGLKRTSFNTEKFAIFGFPFQGQKSRENERLSTFIKNNLQCESKKSPLRGPDISHFSHKRLRIINRFFTHLLYVPIYARLQICILLSPTLTKLCRIKCAVSYTHLTLPTNREV